MSNFLKINKNINSVVKYEAGISKLADRKKVVKLSSNEGAFGTRRACSHVGGGLGREPSAGTDRARFLVAVGELTIIA